MQELKIDNENKVTSVGKINENQHLYNTSLKFKKLNTEAVIPKQAHKGDSGYDLVAISDGEFNFDEKGNLLYLEYHTGLAVEPPVGFRTELWPRSSISKYHLSLCNGIGLIDETYRGELIFRFNLIGITWSVKSQSNAPDYINKNFKIYQKGDKVGQLVVSQNIIANIIEVDKLSDTERKDGGFGSTG